MHILVPLLILLLSGVSMAEAQDRTTEFPAPTGPYQVGSTYRHWVDDSRREMLTEDPADKRDVLVRIWYPAEVPGDAEPMPAVPFAAEQVPIINDGFAGLVDYLDAIAAIQSHSSLDVPLAEADEPFPVVLFSHGLGGMPELHSLQLEELASHGYVVVATYHQYASAAVFPDGRVTTFKNTIPQWGADDQVFVMDQLATLNEDDPEGFFTGRLETSRFGVVGMSYGGDVADIVCRTDARCAAYVNEDGGGSFQSGSDLPPAMFMSANTRAMRTLFNNWDGPAYFMNVATFGHGNFSDMPLWPDGNPTEALLGTAGAASPGLYHPYLVAFFDTHLKGEPSPLLDGPSDDYPDVTFESRNIE